MKNANSEAFPNLLATPSNDGYLSTQGITKREWFAAMAMQGLISNPDPLTSAWSEENIAICALQHADALLAKLNKEEAA